MKLTPWFPASVAPARLGWYDCRYRSGAVQRWFWDGTWRVRPHGSETMFGNMDVDLDAEHWRGLTSEQSERSMEVDRHEDDADNWW